jgi:hypothetical protein
VLQGERIPDARADQLGSVVVNDRRPAAPVARLHLRQILPDGDELNSMARGRGDDAIQVCKGSNARRLVEHDQQRRVEWPARSRGPLERGVKNLTHDSREHRS